MAYRTAADIVEVLDDAERARHGQANSWPSLPGIGPSFPLEERLPKRPSDIPEVYRYTPARIASPVKREQRDVNRPRRYADPF